MSKNPQFHRDPQSAYHGGDSVTGTLIGNRYRVENCLGKGGMGQVYRVINIERGNEYALKMVLTASIQERELRRFNKEIQAISNLEHPGIVHVHEVDVWQGRPYYVMDLVRGVSLKEHLEKFGSIPLDDAQNLFIQVSFALGYAHSKGIIHRDVKPGNIMLVGSDSTGQRIKIVDFGIAKLLGDEESKLTNTGEIFGSPAYMSPEQCVGVGVDSRTDIYALGCVMFECLTGLPPFLSDSPLTTLMKHRTQPPPSLTEASLGKKFPKEMEAIVAKLLSKTPESRYQNLEALADDLICLQSGSRVEIEKPTNSPQSEKQQSGKPQLVLICVAVFFIGYAAASIQGRRTDTPIRQADSSPVSSREKSGTSISANNTKTSLNTPAAPKDDDLDPKPSYSPLQRAELENSSKFYSEQNHRKFLTLPKSVEIGRVFAVDGTKLVSSDGLSTECQARGKIELSGAGGFIGYAARPVLNDFPSLLKRFPPDTLVMLTLIPISKALDNDKTASTCCTDDSLRDLDALPNLQELRCEGSLVDDKILPKIERLKKLYGLEVGRTKVTAQNLARLKLLGQLSTLSMSEMTKPAIVLKALSRTNKMRALTLASCRLHDDDLALIAQLQGLTKLSISDNPQLTPAGLSQLAKLKLIQLEVKNCGFNDKHLQVISGMKDLQWLNIGQNPLLSSTGVAYLSALPKLSHVCFENNMLNTTTVKAFNQIRTLQCVSFTKPKQDLGMQFRSGIQLVPRTETFLKMLD